MSQSAQWAWELQDRWDEAVVRKVAAVLFNGVWELREASGRPPDGEERRGEAAHAPRFHWGWWASPASGPTGSGCRLASTAWWAAPSLLSTTPG